MPGPLHQGLVHLLNHNPQLVFDLARRFDAAFGSGHVGFEAFEAFEAASNELPDPAKQGRILHADGVHAALVAVPHAAPVRVGGVAVEVQTCRDGLKLYSWLSYAAGVRRLFECRGWTMVFAPDADIRRYYEELFADELRARPWFVDPTLLPPIVETRQAAQDLARALLTVVFRARLIQAVPCARATLEALHQSTLDPEDRRVYTQLVRASLKDEQLDRLPKELLQWDDDWEMGPMELTSAYYTRGLAAGREDGLEEGRLVEARRLLVQVLEHRGIRLDDSHRARVDGCTDREQLESWLHRALETADADAIFTAG